MPWQTYVADQALKVGPNGRWVRTTAGLCLARQNGKSALVRMRLLAGLYVFGEAQIAGMAQNRSLALDTLLAVADMADGVPSLRKRIKRVARTNGNEKLEVWCDHWPKDCPPGCNRVRTYRVLAATPDNARGRSIDLLFIDELREISEATWAAAAPTTRARPNPQTWVASNAGDASSTVLNDLRSRALADQSPRLGWWEWSADPALRINDRLAWRQANPALGHLIDEAALEDSIARDHPDTFMTESLCRWVDALDSPWNLTAWDTGLDKSAELRADLPSVAGIDFDFERKTAYMVTVQPDGETLRCFLHGWVRDEPLNEREVASDIAKLARQYRISQIGFDPRASGHLAPHLARAGIRMTPVPWAGADFATSCDVTMSAMNAQRLIHSGQDILRQQLAASMRRPAGDGGWRISRKGSGSIPAAIALVMAVGLADRPQVQVTVTAV